MPHSADNSGGLSGIGLGLGPGGQPIDAAQLNRGGGMSNMGPGGEECILVPLSLLVWHASILSH